MAADLAKILKLAVSHSGKNSVKNSCIRIMIRINTKIVLTGLLLVRHPLPRTIYENFWHLASCPVISNQSINRDF